MTACPTERFPTVAAAQLAAAEREARATLNGRPRRTLTAYACERHGAHLAGRRRVTRAAA